MSQVASALAILIEIGSIILGLLVVTVIKNNAGCAVAYMPRSLSRFQRS